MPLDITRHGLLSSLLYVLLFGTLLWSSWALHSPWAVSSGPVLDSGTAMANWIDQFVIEKPVTALALSWILLAINSLMVSQICIRNVLFLERSFMPSMIYVMICCGDPTSPLNLRYLVASTLVLTSVSLILRSYNIKTIATGTYLKIGTYLSLAAIVAPTTLLLMPLIVVALLLFRKNDIREWIVGLAAYAIPLLGAAYIEWLVGLVNSGEEALGFEQFFVNIVNAISTPSSHPATFASLNLLEWGFIYTVTILIVLSAIKLITTRRAYNSKAVKGYIFSLFMLLFASALMGLPSRTLSMLAVVAIPLAVIIPIYFNASHPSFMMNFMYILLILGSIAVHLVPQILR